MILAALVTLLGAVSADLSFAPWFSEREVSVSIARPAEGAPWIRAVGELPAGADAVAAVVTDYESYGQLFAPFVAKAAVLEHAEDGARLHLVWPYPFPWRNRDAVVRYRGERSSDGGLRLSWQSDGRPGDPREGVRIARVAGETRIEPSGPGHCRVTYTYLGDLGGRFPRTFEEKAWRAEPIGYMLALRRRLGLPVPAAKKP